MSTGSEGMKLPSRFISDSHSTFQYQDDLPSLPIPSLKHTLEAYLQSTRPFLSDEEFAKTKSIVEDFENGIGQELHVKLNEAAKHKRNWLSAWWEKYAYLSVRTPHAPYLNFACVPSLEAVWPAKEGTQMERAAIGTWLIASFWQLLRQEKITIDKGGGKTIWCMAQYLRMFNNCKTPGDEVCQLNHYFKTDKEGGCPHHLAVIHKGRTFSFDLLDSQGGLLTAPEIQSQLQQILDLCADTPSGEGVGALTAHDRDTWKKNRDRLIELHPENLETLEVIQKSVFVLVLEERSPSTESEILREGLFGDPHNRWQDKTLSFVSHRNGLMTLNCDHSPVDGIVMVMLTNFFIESLFLNNGTWQGSHQLRALAKPREHMFHVDSDIVVKIGEATQLMNSAERNVDLLRREFPNFGSDLIKSFGIHPDPVVQLALQLAYFKLHNKPAPTYETASTRKFVNARTETVRSCTQEASAWCTAMLDPKQNDKVRMKLLFDAYKKQKQLMVEAMNGQGIDRHLLGLQIVAMEEGLDMPQLFKDPAYTKSGGGGNFILSTSLTGWAPVVGYVTPMCKDGYGVFYNIQPKRLAMVCGSWRSDETDSRGLLESVADSVDSITSLLAFSQSEAKL